MGGFRRSAAPSPPPQSGPACRPLPPPRHTAPPVLCVPSTFAQVGGVQVCPPSPTTKRLKRHNGNAAAAAAANPPSQPSGWRSSLFFCSLSPTAPLPFPASFGSSRKQPGEQRGQNERKNNKIKINEGTRRDRSYHAPVSHRRLYAGFPSGSRRSAPTQPAWRDGWSAGRRAFRE